jgi:cation:H+ antiporter
MIGLYIIIFIISCALLFGSSKLVIKSLLRIAKFLGWKEFVVAFLAMSFAASLPNLFVGISSAIYKIPQLSFGDIVGGNVIDLTLAIALAVLFTKGGIVAESRTVQKTSIFTLIAAILPLVLIADGNFSRIDGILSIAFFFFYLYWLFSKRERFVDIYNSYKIPILKGLKIFLQDLGGVILGIILLLVAAQGIVRSAQFFAGTFHLPVSLIGILIVGLGNALPETYLAINSAKRGDNWMILGDLMGSVIVPATLVIGIVALICPIKINNFSPFVIARFFLVVSALFFFFFVRTDRKITKKEAVFLLSLYFAFVIIEIIR